MGVETRARDSNYSKLNSHVFQLLPWTILVQLELNDPRKHLILMEVVSRHKTNVFHQILISLLLLFSMFLNTVLLPGDQIIHSVAATLRGHINNFLLRFRRCSFLVDYQGSLSHVSSFFLFSFYEFMCLLLLLTLCIMHKVLWRPKQKGVSKLPYSIPKSEIWKRLTAFLDWMKRKWMKIGFTLSKKYDSI